MPTAATVVSRTLTPTWSYLHLELVRSHPSLAPPTGSSSRTRNTLPVLDALTVRSHLSSALSRFLGLTGAAIPIDILDLAERRVWIRVPYTDGAAVSVALSGWVGKEEGGGNGTGGEQGDVVDIGWKVISSGAWAGSAGAIGGDGMELFGGEEERR